MATKGSDVTAAAEAASEQAFRSGTKEHHLAAAGAHRLATKHPGVRGSQKSAHEHGVRHHNFMASEVDRLGAPLNRDTWKKLTNNRDAVMSPEDRAARRAEILAAARGVTELRKFVLGVLQENAFWRRHK